jgi:hypothetical protein
MGLSVSIYGTDHEPILASRQHNKIKEYCFTNVAWQINIIALLWTVMSSKPDLMKLIYPLVIYLVIK